MEIEVLRKHGFSLRRIAVEVGAKGVRDNSSFNFRKVNYSNPFSSFVFRTSWLYGIDNHMPHMSTESSRIYRKCRSQLCSGCCGSCNSASL